MDKTQAEQIAVQNATDTTKPEQSLAKAQFQQAKAETVEPLICPNVLNALASCPHC